MSAWRCATRSSHDRAWLAGVLAQRWGSTLIARRGTLVDAGELPGLVAEIDDEAVGLATYEEAGGMIEIVTLDALGGPRGVGTALVEALVARAGERHCSRVWLVTTNDNLQALRFYQRRGFRLACLHAGAVDRARALKPGIPVVGSGGLEIHDEIELAREIPPAGVAGDAGAGGDRPPRSCWRGSPSPARPCWRGSSSSTGTTSRRSGTTRWPRTAPSRIGSSTRTSWNPTGRPGSSATRGISPGSR